MKLTTWSSINRLSLIFAIFLAHLFPKHYQEIALIAKTEIKPLNNRFSYTQQDILSLFELIQEEGRQKMMFIYGIIDMAFPIVYGFLFYLLIGKLNKSFSHSIWSLIKYLPILAVLFDYLENFSILYLLYSFPIINKTIVSIGSTATSLKWIFIYLTLSFLVFLSLYRLTLFAKNQLKTN